MTAHPTWFDVTAAPYNATGNGTTDDSSAIQSAINDAGNTTSQHGGIVLFPAGTYLIRSGLSIANQVTLMGVGWQSPVAVGGQYLGGNPALNGSWIKVDQTSFTPLSFTAQGAGMQDMGVRHVQPASNGQTFSPTSYPFAIDVTANDVFLNNVMLLNPTNGINAHGAGSGTVGRLDLRRLFGQPLTTGIQIDNMLDVMKCDDVHFWPFWSGESAVKTYTAQNGTGIYSLRNDNADFSNIFMFGYSYGIHLSKSGGSSPSPSQGSGHRLHFNNCDFDGCNYGMNVDAADSGGTTAVVTNFTMAGGASPQGSFGLIVNAPAPTTIQVTNVHISQVDANAIRCDGGSRVYVNNVWVEDWNRSNSGWQGIEMVGGGDVRVGFVRKFERGGTNGGLGLSSSVTGDP
jgi:hypothetical protein